jgi:hypothetical protein
MFKMRSSLSKTAAAGLQAWRQCNPKNAVEELMAGSDGAESRGGGRWHVTALAILLVLFVFRVSAQLVQSLWPTPLLPPFEEWQSGTLPYGVLLVAQLVIIGAIAFAMVQIRRGRSRPIRGVGILLLVVGAVYMLAAVFRLTAGMSFLSHLPFFQVRLPSVFHMVLASVVLTLGHFHFRGDARRRRNAAVAAFGDRV